MRVVISNSGKVSRPYLEHITLLRGDICQQEVDGVVTLLPQNMDFKGPLNETLAQACGYDLDEFILNHVNRPRAGEVYALPGGDLPARHILLGIMPHYRTEFDMNDVHLLGCMRNVMDLARCMLFQSLAVPSLGPDISGFPEARAARLVTQGITDRMHEGLEDLRIVCAAIDDAAHFQDKLKGLGWSGGKR